MLMLNLLWQRLQLCHGEALLRCLGLRAALAVTLLETGLELLEPRLCGERRSNVAVHVLDLEVDQPWPEKGSEVVVAVHANRAIAG